MGGQGRRGKARRTAGRAAGPAGAHLVTSDDGFHWNVDRDAYVLRAEQPWEGSYNLCKAILARDDKLWLYYFGKKGFEERGGLAFTSDGRTAEKYAGNPIWTKNDSSLPGERVFHSCVVEDQGKVYLFYTIGFDNKHPVHPRHYKICVAESGDGIHFHECPDTPMINHGKSGSFDEKWVSQPSVRKIGPWWYMLYGGMAAGRQNKDGKSFGLARARGPRGPWEKYPENPVFLPALDKTAWDGAFLQQPCPIRIDGTWYLYYTGHGAAGGRSRHNAYAVGLARPSGN